MENIVFADSWGEFFAERSLESFSDFYDYTGGTKIGENQKRSVYKWEFDDPGGTKTLFIKRFKRPHLKDTLAAWCNFGRPISQASVEWENTNLLLQNGIETYKPVCMGERMFRKLEAKSFFITEQLEGTCLIDFVVQKWRALSRDKQEDIVRAMGRLTRRIHSLDVSLPDLYIWHLFIDEAGLNNGCCLSVIDLHRMLRNVRSPEKKLRDLGKLYWSMSSEYFDDELKNLLVAAYAGETEADNIERILRSVLKQASITDRRRKLINHYRRVMTAQA